MQHWSRRSTFGGVRVRTDLDPQEAAVLRGLVSSVVEMLRARADDAPTDELSRLTGLRTGHSDRPQDESLLRLLPDFHRLDDVVDDREQGADAAGALRSLHEPEIIDAKCAAAQVLLDSCPPRGGRVTLNLDQADAWLATINDVRLTLGTMLDIGPDTPDELPEDDPRAGHLGVYHWLTFVQESLVESLMG